MSMRNLMLAGVLLAAPGLAGCGALDFDVQQNIPEQRVSGSVVSALLGTLIPSPFPLTIDLAQETKARGTGPVKAAGLKSLTFAITSTASSGSVHDFSFVQTVDIYIESTKSGTTLTRQKIAELGSSEADRPKLHFEIRRQGKPVDPAKLLPAR